MQENQVVNNYQEKKEQPSLGIIRLDYDYPPALGEIDCAESFDYDVYYKVVPGLTFEMCKSGILLSKVEYRFKEAIRWLVKEKKVSAITGDCGFMMYFQSIAREVTSIPVFMSSLCQLPMIHCAFSSTAQIAILTANSKSFYAMHGTVKVECGIDSRDNRYHVIGCEDVEGFDAVDFKQKVDTEKVEPGIVRKALEALDRYPETKVFLLECTQLPPYADAIRVETGLPVFDAITTCNAFMEALRDNVRFGRNDWQEEWDGIQDEYEFAMELTTLEKKELLSNITRITEML